MKRIISFLFGITLILILVIACDKEEPLTNNGPQIFVQSAVVVEEVNFNSVPELSEALNTVMGESKLARSYSERGDSRFWIDEDKVLRLRDSVDNESYSVVIHANGLSSKTFYNLIVTKRIDDNPIVPFVVEYNFAHGDIFSFAQDDEKNFDGTVNIYSLEEFATVTRLNSKDTTPVACFRDVGQNNYTVAGSGSSGSSSSGSSGGSSNAGSTGSSQTVSVTRPHISVSRTYGSSRSGGSVYGGTVTMYFPGKKPERFDQKTKTKENKGKSPCPEGYVSIPINEITLFEDKIDDLALAPCLKQILNDLKKLKSGVGPIVTKFAGNSPGFNWKVQDGRLGGGTGATDPPANYNHSTGTITTTFDSKKWNQATDLSWARTILHESVHAFLATEFAINKRNWVATYPQMVAEWGRLQNWNDVHHEEFARSIVNDIAIALQEYGKSKGYSYSSQFYQDLAWGGLHTTSTFTALPTTTKNRILDIIAIELTGKDLNSNNQSQNGVNAGC